MTRLHAHPRWLIVCVACLVIALVTAGPLSAAAKSKYTPYKALVLMDSETGQLLAAEHAHEAVIPASLVKMMVLYLVMEQVQAGTIHFADVVTVSEWASKMGGQQVYLKKGETFTLEQLLDAMVIGSANDAAVAVAEYLAGSTEACVARMNAKAQSLGMTQTEFANVHGLPPSKGQVDNVTTAYDIAVLGRALLTRFPQVLNWTASLRTTFRQETVANTNRYLLRHVSGVDGLKTGYHRKSGFNVCVTAKRGNRRLIGVVMGSPTKIDRNRVAKELLTAGFASGETLTKLKK